MSQQIDIKKTRQVRITASFHKDLRIEAAERGLSIRAVLEERAGWGLDVQQGFWGKQISHAYRVELKKQRSKIISAGLKANKK